MVNSENVTQKKTNEIKKKNKKKDDDENQKTKVENVTWGGGRWVVEELMVVKRGKTSGQTKYNNWVNDRVLCNRESTYYGHMYTQPNRARIINTQGK